MISHVCVCVSPSKGGLGDVPFLIRAGLEEGVSRLESGDSGSAIMLWGHRTPHVCVARAFEGSFASQNSSLGVACLGDATVPRAWRNDWVSRDPSWHGYGLLKPGFYECVGDVAHEVPS